MLMPKYREHAEHILGTYLQYADHIQCILRATMSIGVKGRKKEKKAAPKAARAYGRQLIRELVNIFLLLCLLSPCWN